MDGTDPTTLDAEVCFCQKPLTYVKTVDASGRAVQPFVSLAGCGHRYHLQCAKRYTRTVAHMYALPEVDARVYEPDAREEEEGEEGDKVRAIYKH
jgi:hypothetical protein